MGGGERTSNPCSTAQRFTSLFIPLDADGPLPFEQCGTGLTPRVGFKYCFAFASNVTGPRDQAETDFFSGHRKGYYWIKALASAASLIEIRRSQEGTETRESPAHTSNSVELNHSRPPNHTTGPSPSRQHVFLQSRDPQRRRSAFPSLSPFLSPSLTSLLLRPDLSTLQVFDPTSAVRSSSGRSRSRSRPPRRPPRRMGVRRARMG